MLVYVDGLLTVGADLQWIRTTKRQLTEQFEMEDLDECISFVAIAIGRTIARFRPINAGVAPAC